MTSFAMLTTIGRNKEAAALANGSPINIANIAWGDGARVPDGSETALLNEQGRKPVQQTGLTDGALNTAYFEVQFLEAEGPYIIREAGLFDDEGDLIAIAVYDPPINKPKDTVSAVMRMHVAFSHLEDITIHVEGADAYVPTERQVIAGNGLTGGGNLVGDVTLQADLASDAETKAGIHETKLITPKSLTGMVAGNVAGARCALTNGTALPVDVPVSCNAYFETAGSARFAINANGITLNEAGTYKVTIGGTFALSGIPGWVSGSVEFQKNGSFVHYRAMAVENTEKPFGGSVYRQVNQLTFVTGLSANDVLGVGIMNTGPNDLSAGAAGINIELIVERLI